MLILFDFQDKQRVQEAKHCAKTALVAAHASFVFLVLCRCWRFDIAGLLQAEFNTMVDCALIWH